MRRIRTGFLSALVVCVAGPAAAEPEIVSGLELPMQCWGGEPFWGLKINNAKSATYIWDNQPTAWKVLGVDHAMQRPTTWRVRFAGKSRQAFIFDEGQQACSDSDGEKPYAYGILLQDGDALFRGCCAPKE